MGGVVPFGDIYQEMQLQASKDRRYASSIGAALSMSEQEKKVSFLNNAFVFKKAGKGSGRSSTQSRTKRRLQVVGTDANAK